MEFVHKDLNSKNMAKNYFMPYCFLELQLASQLFIIPSTANQILFLLLHCLPATLAAVIDTVFFCHCEECEARRSNPDAKRYIFKTLGNIFVAADILFFK
jgi:hypothetical protein